MLYVPQMEIVTPSNMEAYRSLLVVVWVAVGGRGTLSGAVLGALAVNLLYNYFTSQHDFYLFSWNPDYWQILLGLMFVLVVLYLPNGLIGVLDKLRGSIDFKERENSIMTQVTHEKQSPEELLKKRRNIWTDIANICRVR